MVRIAKPKGPSDPFEKEVHEEEYSNKHKEKGVAGLFACNQETLTKTSANIKEVGAVNEANKSTKTQDSEDERRLDEDIGVGHTLQEQEDDDRNDTQPNLAVNHVREEGRDGGQVSIIEKLLAGIEVVTAPNANAHKQPWYEYPRQVYNPPLLHFEDIVDIFATKHGYGLKGKTITPTMDVNLPPLLVLDNNELLMGVTNTDSLYVGLQVSVIKYVCPEVVVHVHRLETKLDWITITGSGCIEFELDEIFPMEVLGQLRLGIDIGNLRMKMKRPQRRKKERGMKPIEKAGIG